MNRNISIKGIDFVIADYRPRRNEFERGLKYQALIKVFDGPRDCDYSFRSTGAHFSTIKAAKRWISSNYIMYM